jgi:cellulose biosynthesis protein BcsQ
MLDESDTAAGKTLWSAIKPIAETTGDLIDIEPIEHENDLYILPGDIQLAQFETLLGDMWGDCFQSRVRGLRGVTALSLVVNRVCNKLKIDYVFYDSGPNIGPLNRAILLDCDHFIIPAACDLFSIRALKTLGKTLSEWIKGWVVIDQLAPDGVYLLHGRPKLLGYIPQRFRVYSGLVSSQYQKYFARLEKQVFSDVAAVLQLTDPALAPRAATKMNLGAIKDFSSLVNAAQQEGVPLWRVTGGAAYLRGEADSAFAALAQKIITAVDGG